MAAKYFAMISVLFFLVVLKGDKLYCYLYTKEQGTRSGPVFLVHTTLSCHRTHNAERKDH